MLNNKIEEILTRAIPEVEFKVFLKGNVPDNFLNYREETRDLLIKDYQDVRKVIGYSWDNPMGNTIHSMLYDYYEQHVENSIYSMMLESRKLEDKVIEDILKEWGYDITSPDFGNQAKKDELMLKREYEYRVNGDREYLWLIKYHAVELVSIKQLKEPSYRYSDSQATIGFDLYLAREVKDE